MVLRLLPEPPARKLVFFVRHGESVWNAAQERHDVYSMMKETDHGLSVKGMQQAEALGRRIRRAARAAMGETEGQSDF